MLRLARSFDGSATEEPIIERGGGLLFNRSPRVEVRYPGTLFKMPRLPTEKIGRMFPWPILIAPILMGMALYALNGNPRSLLLIVMTPLMAFGNIINQSAQSKKGENHEILLFERQYEQLEEDFFHGKPEEELARNAEAPPVAEIFDHAMRLGPMLWTRRPEHWNFLGLRLGSCRLPARNSIDDAETPDGLPDFIDRVDRLRERYAFVDDVPVFDTFVDAGSIGIAGPQGPVADTMRGLAVQLFGLHAPNDVVAVAFADSAWTPELEWLKWMPHTSSDKSPFRDMALADSAPTGATLLSALEEYVQRAQTTGGGGEPRGPFKEDWNPLLYGTDVARAASEHKKAPALSVIVFVSSDAPVDRGRLTDVLERGADHGVHAVFVSPTVESLPAVCRSFIDVTAGLDAADVGLVRNGERFGPVRVEGVSNAYMEMLARRLAPVVDASTGVHDSSDIPTSVMFLQLVDPAIARGSSDRHRALAAEQHDRGPHRQPATASEEGGHPQGDHRTGAEQRHGAGSAHSGAARSRGRHHRCGQVGVPAGLGARHGCGAQPGPRDVPVRRLQGRLRVRGLRRASALRRTRDRPQSASGAPRARRACAPNCRTGSICSTGRRRRTCSSSRSARIRSARRRSSW